MSSTSFTEWTREEKDEFAKERMDKMKLINEKLKRRHAEVEEDRIKAEAKNSSITSSSYVLQKREKSVSDKEEVTEAKIIHEREWDRGKTEEHWNSSNPYCSQSRFTRRDYRDKRFDRREDTWRPQSNVNRDNRRHFMSDSMPDKKTIGNNNLKHGESNYNFDATSNARRSRGRFFRPTRPPFRSSQKTRPYESRNRSEYIETNVFKKHLYAAGSSSPSVSDSEQEPEVNLAKTSEFTDKSSVWDDVEITDVQHKQSRVEKWVKSIPSSWVDDDKPNKEYSRCKYESGNFHDKDRKHDHSFKSEWGNESVTRGKSNVGYRDQTQFREKESKFDGQRSVHFRGGFNARGNRNARESFKESVGSDFRRRGNPNRRRNFHERNKWQTGFTSVMQNDKCYGKDISPDKRTSESYNHGKTRYKTYNEHSVHSGLDFEYNNRNKSSKFKQGENCKIVKHVEEPTSCEWNYVSESYDNSWDNIDQSGIWSRNENEHSVHSGIDSEYNTHEKSSKFKQGENCKIVNEMIVKHVEEPTSCEWNYVSESYDNSWDNIDQSGIWSRNENEHSVHSGLDSEYNNHDKSSKNKQGENCKIVNEMIVKHVEEPTSCEWNYVSESYDNSWDNIDQSDIRSRNEESISLYKNKGETDDAQQCWGKSHMYSDLHSSERNAYEYRAQNIAVDVDHALANSDQSDIRACKDTFLNKNKGETDEASQCCGKSPLYSDMHSSRRNASECRAQNTAVDIKCDFQPQNDKENLCVDSIDPIIGHDNAVGIETDPVCTKGVVHISEHSNAGCLNAAESINFQEQVVEKGHELNSVQSDIEDFKMSINKRANESESLVNTQDIPRDGEKTFRSETPDDSNLVHSSNETVYESKLSFDKNTLLSTELSAVFESCSLPETVSALDNTEVVPDVEHFENFTLSKTISVLDNAEVVHRKDSLEESTQFSDLKCETVPDNRQVSKVASVDSPGIASEITGILSELHLCDEDVKGLSYITQPVKTSTDILIPTPENTVQFSKIIHYEETENSCVMSTAKSESSNENSHADSKLSSSYTCNMTEHDKLLDSSVCNAYQSSEKLQSPENTCALSLSDDGGWSTVSEENDCSDDSTNCDDKLKK